MYDGKFFSEVTLSGIENTNNINEYYSGTKTNVWVITEESLYYMLQQ